MRTKQTFAMKMTYWLKVVSLGIILGLGLQFAQAWVAPTLPPPSGNVSGPITTGDQAQTKSGSLGVAQNLAVGAIGGSSNICLNGVCISSWDQLQAPPNPATSQTFNNPKKGGLPIATFGGNGWTTWEKWCQEQGFTAAVGPSFGPPAQPCAGNANRKGVFTSWRYDWNCNFAVLSKITCVNY